MTKPHQTATLLDDIASRLGCDYLSDLRFQPGWKHLISQVVSSIPPEKYALKEWNDAAQYLTGGPVSFLTAEEAKRFLQESLSEL